MNVIVLFASPNKDGLTAACAQALVEGIQQGGSEAESICLNDLNIGQCKACNRGWGTCQNEHVCQEQDDFQGLHEKVAEADALGLVTPVYWGDLSEPAKAFLDRLRRCEATRREESRLAGKWVVSVGAAGGSGNGTMTCLASLERWTQHVRGRVFDLIPVNRWTRGYKLVTLRAAGEALARELVEKKF